MNRTAIWAVCAVLLVGCASQSAEAQLARRSGTFGGLDLSFWVAYPEGYEAGGSYPTVLVFGGGPQTLDGASRTIESDWRDEARRRGYVVVAPGTPDGRLFFQGADRVFPEFLDYLVEEFHPEDGLLHVAGHSNGGSSAFHVAALYPQYFKTVVGYPGLLNGQADAARMAALEPLCVFMHVGDSDASWRNAMRRQEEEMRGRSFRVELTVEPNQGHRLRAAELDLSRRLFEEIESCR
jgi:poly(3-hydroxybutyrate) depolymerase